MQEETKSPFEQDEVTPPAWTAEQVRAWRLRNPSISLWVPVKAQGYLALAALGLYLGMRNAVSASLFWGAMAAALPAVLSVLGYTRTQRYLANQPQSTQAVFGLVSVFFWEAVKLLLSIVLLFLAPRWLVNVNWLALLVAFVLVVKVYWLALMFAGKRK